MSTAEQKPKKRAGLILLLILIIIGSALRIYGAWCYRNTTDPDAGIVSLMAKHMAEGGALPTFFYGQAYMGSLEPLASAALCRLFGINGFSIALGPALLSIFLLPLIFLWARKAGDTKAGLAAVAYFLIGPHYAFAFQCIPRGGYVLTLLISVLLIGMTCHYVSHFQKGSRLHGGWLFSLGLIAGIGWWTNQLVLYAFLTVAVLFILSLRRGVFSWRWGYSALGFILGSLPLWIWNIQHDWKTFAFLKSPGGTSLELGLERFFGKRLQSFFGIREASTIEQIYVLGLHALLLVAAAYYLYSKKNKAEQNRSYQYAPWIFFAVTLLVYGTSEFSNFNTARYLIPLAPAIAIVIGLGTSHLSRKIPWKLGYMPLLLIMAWQLRTVGDLAERNEVYTARKQSAEALGHFMEEQNLKSAYIPFAKHWLNFQLNEKFAFTDVKSERYKPYAVTAEQDDNPAILDNYGLVESFLTMTGGRAEKGHTDAYQLCYNWVPPSLGCKEIDPSAWKDAVDSHGNSLLARVTDRNLDTYWNSEDEKAQVEWIDVTFHQPVPVHSIRILSGNSRFDYPDVLQVYGKLANSDRIVDLTEKLYYSSYYWSGPRPYWGGYHYRMNINLAPATVQSLRIMQKNRNMDWYWWITELQIFGPKEEPTPEEASLGKLLTLLEEKAVTRLYCDRWVANKVYQKTRGSIQTPLEPRAYTQEDLPHIGPMKLGAQTAILSLAQDANLCREVLNTLGLEMRETSLAPWVLFDFEPGTKPEYANAHSLRWEGFACFIGGAKQRAAKLIQEAQSSIAASGPSTNALQTIEQALRLEPNYATSLPKLSNWFLATGSKKQAEDAALVFHQKTVPTMKAPILFKNGVEFLGLSIEEGHISAGKETSIHYYWKCPASIDAHQLAVFVHFIKDDERLQNDHVLLSNFRKRSLNFQPLGEVFHQTRRLAVPASAQEGSYKMLLGLYDRVSGKRIGQKTELLVENDAAILPGVFVIR